MPIYESLYNVTENSRNKLLNTGFDYKGQIFNKTMSSFIFLSATRTAILAKLEIVYYELIESVKEIKIHFDFSKKKDFRNFN